MKKWFSLLLSLILICTFCLSFAEADGAALYEQGKAAFLAQDYETAFDSLAQSAELGYDGAYAFIGELYRDGLGVEQNDEKAADYFLKAVELGDTNEAQANFDHLVEEGRIPADYTPNADTDPLCDLGKAIYEAGDYEKAAECFRKAAELGIRRGLCNMGVLYQYGKGVEQSSEKAVEYFQLAADQGFSLAQYNLGVLYTNGIGVEQNYEKALEYFQLAADQGMKEAQHNLAFLYANGLGVEQSYEKAMEYSLLAADQGLTEAKHNVGVLYANGLGVEQNYEKAFEYWTQAAEQGYYNAFEALGELYRDGLGVEQSYEKAADYFLKAVELGETQKAQAFFDQLVEEGKIPANYTPNEI